MNELIKKLANESGGIQKYVPAPGVWQFFDAELEEFAESIVRECIMVLNTPNESDNTKPIQDKLTMLYCRIDAMHRITTHFTTGEKNGKSTQAD